MSLLSTVAISRAALFERLASSSLTVIAANRRLVRDGVWRFGLWQQSRGLSVWPTPAIMTFDDYLQQLWQQQLLTDHAERWPQPARILAALDRRRIWQHIIAQQEGERALLRLSETARLAAEAFELEIEFDLPAAAQASDDVLRYRSWRQRFVEWCQKKNWQTPAQWQTHCLRAIEASDVLTSASFVLLGFDDVSPSLRRFCDMVSARGGQLSHVVEAHAVQREQRLSFISRDDEMQHAVYWALQQADAGQRVALVMPDLTTRRHDIDRVLRRTIHPDAAQAFSVVHKGRYNMSAGGSLLEQAMVQTALLLLRLIATSSRDWSLSDISQLLHSPFIGDYARDAAQRARLDAKWRAIGNEQLRASKVIQQFEAWGLSTLHSHCVAARSAAAEWPHKTLPSQWAEFFQLVLQQIGWPGTRTLDSVAWQLVNRFEEVLLDMATLDDVCGKTDANEALYLLQQLCSEIIFQPQANAQAPIQVLGMLEVSGQVFDAIWVMHMADEQLPAAPKPNPFIAMSLQKKYGLPRSSIEREWDYVQRWQHSLRFSSQHLIWSCAERDGDTALRASALISAMPITATDAVVTLPIAASPAPLDLHCDEGTIAFAADEVIKGGVEALRAQARNPLAAFAQFRLNAEAVEPITVFTTPRLHGLLIHACLQAFWAQTTQQSRLLEFSPAELNSAIDAAIASAFVSIEQREGRTLPPVWRRLETELLQRLLQEWLTLEKNRSPFQIAATEQALQWQYRNWTLQVRVDRVDVNANGQQLVIDYKSGSAPSPAQWYQSPLFEPQLPLYAMIIGDNVNAIAFAQLKRGDMKWSGRALDDSWGIVKAEPEWSTLRAQWQRDIHTLADSFINGEYSNRYWFYDDMKQHPLRPFLRIALHSADDENGGAE